MAQERLTDEDITKLVAKMKTLANRLPGESFTKIFSMAQDAVLPLHKRYRKTVLQQRTKWSQKLQRAIKDAGMWPGHGHQPVSKSPEAAAPAHKPEKTHSHTPAPAAKIVQAPAPVPASAPKPEDPLPGLVSMVMERMFRDVWDRVTPQIDQQIKQRLEEILTRPLPEIGGVVGGEDQAHMDVIRIIEHKSMPKSVPRFFVIGLLPEQILALRKKITDLSVELRFWKNEAQTKLNENAEWADEIIIMSRFVSHSDIHAVRNKGRNKVRYCNGAVSDLERQIRFALEGATA